MASWPNNVRYALRVLRKDTGFTLTTVLTLALGTGAATTIFSVVNTVLLQPLGYRDPDALVLVRERIRKVTPELLAVPAPDVVEFQGAEQAFAGAAGWLSDERDLSNDGGPPVRTHVTRATANLFALAGAQPALGRTFTQAEDTERRPVALLSNALWRTRYASDPNIAGRSIMLDRVPHTIVGVMPAGFVFPPQGLRASEPASVWVPMAFSKRELEAIGDMFNYGVIARLGPGVSLDGANGVLAGVAQRIHERYPAEVRSEFGLEAVAVPLRDQVVGQVRTLVWLLAGAVLLLLLIACGNVANLLLSRAAAREREFAIRAAVGAGRATIAAQWLTESLVLAAAAGTLGILLALYGTEAVARLTTLDIPRISEVHVDWRVLSVSIGISLMTALLFGAAPALFTARADLTEGLKESGRSSAGKDRQRARSLLVISEVALALMLLVGAGLLLRSFLAVRATDPGFRAEHVLAMKVTLPEAAYTRDAVPQFFERLDGRLRGLPGALAVGAGNDLPMRGAGWHRLFTTDNEGALQGKHPPTAFTVVWRDYLQALGIPLKRGRLFTDQDREAAVNIVSETTARTLWPGQDPIGKHLKWGPPNANTPWHTVIGVVGDVKEGSLEHTSTLHIYAPAGQSYDEGRLWFTDQHWVIRSAQSPGLLASAVRSAVASIDPQMPVANLETMERTVDGTLSSRRIETFVIGLFAGAALLLAAIGIYGLIAYSVVQRTHEIGVRVALGATAVGVVGLVLRQAVLLAVAGIAAGTVLSLVLARFIASLLYGVKPADFVTYGAVATVLVVAAGAASFIPARRALRVDPMIALRRE